MDNENKLASFLLTSTDKGYLFRFGSTNCIPLFFNDDGSSEFTGVMMFAQNEPPKFKDIEVRKESLKSVIPMIIAQEQYWTLVSIDFVTDTGRTLKYDAGDCVLSFTEKEDLYPYLKRILGDEDNVIPLYNLLGENIGHTILYDSGDFTVMPKYDSAYYNFDVEPETESPF